jgi:hypothetical protein
VRGEMNALDILSDFIFLAMLPFAGYWLIKAVCLLSDIKDNLDIILRRDTIRNSPITRSKR